MIHFEKPTYGWFFRVFYEKTRKKPSGLDFFKKSFFFANPDRIQYLQSSTCISCICWVRLHYSIRANRKNSPTITTGKYILLSRMSLLKWAILLDWKLTPFSHFAITRLPCMGDPSQHSIKLDSRYLRRRINHIEAETP